jgi:mono/diheme cytochrome c family protein
MNLRLLCVLRGSGRGGACHETCVAGRCVHVCRSSARARSSTEHEDQFPRTLVCGLFLGPAFALTALTMAPSAAVGQPNIASVWDGAYRAAQADRGKDVYLEHCSRCHGEDLAGRNPLSGDHFAEQWESRTLADLFRRIRDTMPPGEAMTVDRADKLDAMAYVLQQNGFPEGTADLIDDENALGAIQITRKTGPGPLRTGALVRVAGCLAARDGMGWQLTSATEPQRAALNPASGARRPTQPSGEVGTRIVALLNPFPSPQAHVGHRMLATGFLVRNADGDAVNVVSLEMIAPACVP